MIDMLAYETKLGRAYNGRCEEILKTISRSCRKKVQLILTSPPFALNTKKRYGNLKGQQYLDWIASFVLHGLTDIQPLYYLKRFQREKLEKGLRTNAHNAFATSLTTPHLDRFFAVGIKEDHILKLRFIINYRRKVFGRRYGALVRGIVFHTRHLGAAQ